MKKTISMVSAVLFLVALIAGAYVLYEILGSNYKSNAANQSAASQQSNRDMAPDFTVLDGDGNEVKLSDFRGTPVVLNFWATWCGPCKNELPDFDKKCSDTKGQVAFLMVNLTDGYQETVSSVKTFVSNNGYTFPVYFDTKSEAARAYGVNAIPSTYFIGADGTIVSHHIGMIDAASLQRGIDGICSGAGTSASSGNAAADKGGIWIAAGIALLSLCGAVVTAVIGLLGGNQYRSQVSYGTGTMGGRGSGMSSSGSGSMGSRNSTTRSGGSGGMGNLPGR